MLTLFLSVKDMKRRSTDSGAADATLGTLRRVVVGQFTKRRGDDLETFSFVRKASVVHSDRHLT